MKNRTSLKFKLVSTYFSLLLFLSFTLYIIMYQDSCDTFFNEQKKNISHEMNAVSNTLNLDIHSLKSILYSITSDSSISRLLSDPTPISIRSIEQKRNLEDKLQVSSLDSYINKLMITTEEQAVITLGTQNGTPDDMVHFMELPYLETLLTTSFLGAAGIVDEPVYCWKGAVQAIPLASPIYNTRKHKTGYLYLSVNPTLISDKMSGYSSFNHELLYFKINELYYQLVDGIFTLCQVSPEIAPEYLKSGSVTQGSVLLKNRSYDAIISTLDTEQWSLIQLIDSGQIPFGISPPSYPLILLLLIGTFFLLLLLIHFWINKPVTEISHQLEQISRDISVSTNTEHTSAEFEKISRGIETMRSELNHSFSEILTAQRMRQELEFKVLQYQINPHFISNSLNTIKWMADMQGSYGISTMAVSLSRLFRSVIRNDDTFITLRQELETLNDYITIQRYRYKDIFTYEEIVSDPTLLDTDVMKFTFQPVIENAIFHGIASSGKFGTIRLSADRTGDDIEIRIFDDGIGMTEEQIQSLFSQNDILKNSLSKIGIRNIDQRLKMEYGSLYGLTISSIPGEHTLVTIRYPDRRRKPYVQTGNH